MDYINKDLIKSLREERGMTQKALAQKLNVSDKTVSKWETGRGLPDVGILPELADALGISAAELFTGMVVKNANRSADMTKTVFYVCPVCGNVIFSIGSGSFSCCGVNLPALEAEEAEGEIHIEPVENEYYTVVDHEMTRKHYISFAAYASKDGIEVKKFYPEQMAECRFTRRGHGRIYYYCTRHGLSYIKV